MGKKYSSKEIDDIFKKSSFPVGLTSLEMVRIIYWSVFNFYKFQYFVEQLDNGKIVKFAYMETKKLKKNYENK